MIKKNLVIVADTYTDRNGNEKKKWQTIGQLHEGKHGDYITLDPLVNLGAIPRKEGDSRVYVNLFDIKDRGDGGNAPRQDAPPDLNDDIPW